MAFRVQRSWSWLEAVLLTAEVMVESPVLMARFRVGSTLGLPCTSANEPAQV